MCIKDEKYERNEFIFNFCIVLPTKFPMLPYEAVVRRLASTFAEMELQNQFLSQEGSGKSKDRRSISALIEIVMEDLNNYGECMIPVGELLFSLSLSLCPYSLCYDEHCVLCTLEITGRDSSH